MTVLSRLSSTLLELVLSSTKKDISQRNTFPELAFIKHINLLECLQFN